MIELYTTERTENGFRIVSNGPKQNTVRWSLYPDRYEETGSACGFSAEITIEDPAPGKRVYFHIQSEAGYTVTAVRDLGLSSVSNARDMGMYETADGTAAVRPGVFLRTAKLGFISEKDVQALTELGVKLVYDLRSPDETERSPDKAIPGAMMKEGAAGKLLDLRREERKRHLPHKEFLLLPFENHQPEIERTAMSYRELPFDNNAYRELMDLLLEGKAPAVFHCAAGKDRTGFGAALILMALGVPDETIVYDYLLTNRFQAKVRNALWQDLRSQHDNPKELERVLEWLYLVREEYIRSAFAEIDSRYGSRAEYLRKEIGFDDEKVRRFKDMYLIRHK